VLCPNQPHQNVFRIRRHEVCEVAVDHALQRGNAALEPVLTSGSWPTTRADASTRSPMAHLLSALLVLGRHNSTADQHTAEMTFTPTGRRPQGRSLCDISQGSVRAPIMLGRTGSPRTLAPRPKAVWLPSSP
jgi:hypothetical protein